MKCWVGLSRNNLFLSPHKKYNNQLIGHLVTKNTITYLLVALQLPVHVCISCFYDMILIKKLDDSTVHFDDGDI